MSIPTYNLYNFVAQALENKFLIKYFYPWGEKGFANIIDNYKDKIPGHQCRNISSQPVVLCHDQEPLDFDLYSDTQLQHEYNQLTDWVKQCIQWEYKDLNLRWHSPTNCNQFWTLLHSELNSPEVVRYESTDSFRCAYWWSHAIIARDWYRFALYDNRLKRESQDIKANFLVYARGQTGKRAYRIQFVELLKKISSVQLGSIDEQIVTSNTSAEYTPNDFTRTNCSLVLETVIDRIHLTEKTLRPIACGHPFILYNGQGALETLRSYGFHTFQPYIDESYDKEIDPTKRMHKILQEMNRINNSSKKYQEYIWKGCQEIADYNKKLFFSDKFLWRVKTELRKNVRTLPESKIDYRRIRKLHVGYGRKYRLDLDTQTRRDRVEQYLKLKSTSI